MNRAASAHPPNTPPSSHTHLQGVPAWVSPQVLSNSSPLSDPAWSKGGGEGELEALACAAHEGGGSGAGMPTLAQVGRVGMKGCLLRGLHWVRLWEGTDAL
jgi:hypothetical protein